VEEQSIAAADPHDAAEIQNGAIVDYCARIVIESNALRLRSAMLRSVAGTLIERSRAACERAAALRSRRRPQRPV